MSKGKKKDKELTRLVGEFIQKFSSAVIPDFEGVDVDKGYGLSIGPAGIVRIDKETSSALWGVVHRSAALLGSAAAHEKSIYSTVLNQAHENIVDIDKSEWVSRIIDAIFEKAGRSFSYLVPNRLFRFSVDVRSVQIGRVQAGHSSEFIEQRRLQYPSERLDIFVEEEFSIRFVGDRVNVTIPEICRYVQVNATEEDVEEEAKWIIDVAVSYLRLTYSGWKGPIPGTQDKEAHPLRIIRGDKAGIKFDGPKVNIAGPSASWWYEIDADVAQFCLQRSFKENAELVTDPPQRSLAERVSQGLGWLTRGRQAEDRAERLLYFFTAIESLLSREDKLSPVVQTIARHAAVIWSDDNGERVNVSKDIRRLYVYRSALVHSDNRSVLWSAVAGTQTIAENLFYNVLKYADLRASYQAFCDELGDASYGLPWSRRRTNEEGT